MSEKAEEVAVEKIRLIKPDEATGRVKEIYDEIVSTEGKKWLVPLWGFFAHVPKLLELTWEMLKTLEVDEGLVPRELMSSIAMVCAVDANCERCTTYHQTTLVERMGMSNEEAEKIRFFEESDMPEERKKVLRFCKKVAFGQQVSPEEFTEIKKLGYNDAQIVEMVTLALFESGLARHGAVLAQYEDGMDWPSEYTPSAHYKKHVDS